jgi:hypothetical protein
VGLSIRKVPLDMLHACRRVIVADSTHYICTPRRGAQRSRDNCAMLCCCACRLACERSFGQSNVTIRLPRFRPVSCAPYKICGGCKKMAHLWCLASESSQTTAPSVGSFASEEHASISGSLLGFCPSISRQRFRSMPLLEFDVLRPIVAN